MSEIENVTLAMQRDSPINLSIQSGPHVTLDEVAQLVSPTGILYNATEFWDSQKSMVSAKGCIYVYNDYYSDSGEKIPAIKIGDGTTYLIDLPFIDDGLLMAMKAHMENTKIHVSDSERTRWDNASTFSIDGENLKIGGIA